MRYHFYDNYPVLPYTWDLKAKILSFQFLQVVELTRVQQRINLRGCQESLHVAAWSYISTSM